MKNAMKLSAFAGIALLFAGCAGQQPTSAEMAALQTSVEQARAAAVQAQQTSQQALQIAQGNAAKIDRVFLKSQLK